MPDPFSYPENLAASSLADRDSKTLRIASTISYALHVFKGKGEVSFANIDEILSLTKLASYIRHNHLSSETLAGIHKDFLVNILSLTGSLPEDMIGCIRVDISDLLGIQPDPTLRVAPSFSPRHYYTLASSRISREFDFHAKNHMLREQMGKISQKPRLVITPLTQISVGHLFYLYLAITCSFEMEYSIISPNTLVVVSEHGYGKDLYHRALSQFADRLLIYSNTDRSLTSTHLYWAWQAEAWALTLGPTRLGEVENNVHRLINANNTVQGNDIVFHLRTSGWKRDGHYNAYRDCEVDQYIELIKSIGSLESVIVITGDRQLAMHLYSSGIRCHLVKDRNSSKQQWDLLAKAKLIVGCASGISHLESLSNAPVVYLNVMTQIINFPIKHKHMFSFRRLRVKASNIDPDIYSPINLFYGVLCGYDSGSPSFENMFEVCHLTPKEMLADYNEAVSFFRSSVTEYPFTNRHLAADFGIEYNGPTRNLTSRAYREIKEAMHKLERA